MFYEMHLEETKKISFHPIETVLMDKIFGGNNAQDIIIFYKNR